MLNESETIYRIILASFLMPLLLSGLLIWFFISYQRKKFQNETDKKDALLREQALLIEKQQAIELERNRIAAEMHDDLGSGLTTIRYLSDKALLQAQDTGEASQIRRIADHSNQLVRNMSEIIWAMNTRFDSAENLAGYLRRYASEFLEERGIPYQFMAEAAQWQDVSVSGERRRNLFLVFKEVLHNTAKHAAASRIEIRVTVTPDFTIHIEEQGGAGFDPDNDQSTGNGLYNCRKRMAAIGGNISYQRAQDGLHIRISAPLEVAG